jgi:hypothetical protein
MDKRRPGSRDGPSASGDGRESALIRRGDTPNFPWKAREKWAESLKFVSWQISVTVMEVESSRVRARSSLRSISHFWGVVPNAAAKRRRNAERLSPKRPASFALVTLSVACAVMKEVSPSSARRAAVASSPLSGPGGGRQKAKNRLLEHDARQAGEIFLLPKNALDRGGEPPHSGFTDGAGALRSAVLLGNGAEVLAQEIAREALVEENHDRGVFRRLGDMVNARGQDGGLSPGQFQPPAPADDDLDAAGGRFQDEH